MTTYSNRTSWTQQCSNSFENEVKSYGTRLNRLSCGLVEAHSQTSETRKLSESAAQTAKRCLIETGSKQRVRREAGMGGGLVRSVAHPLVRRSADHGAWLGERCSEDIDV